MLWRPRRTDHEAAVAAPYKFNPPSWPTVVSYSLTSNPTDTKQPSAPHNYDEVEHNHPLKSRTEDLREDGADQMWRGHVLGEEEYLNVQDECVPAGKTCETRTVHGTRPCEDAYEADSESQFDQHGDCDMDTLSPTTPVDVAVESLEPYDPYYDHYDPDEFDCEEELLRAFHFDRRSLILHSLHPDISPHIVITPPPNPWDAYWAYISNSLWPQWPEYLTVPAGAYSCAYDSGPQEVFPEYNNARDTAVYMQCTCPDEEQLVVSSRSEFKRRVSSAAQERLMRYQTMLPLCRNYYQAAVHSASMIAPSFRARWDLPAFVQLMEKSFEWIDPAEPLLAFFAHCHGATIIDSDQPFTAPHIVIQEAPLQSPWEIEEHKTVYPQDSGFGYYLMIPGVHEDYIINSTESIYDDPFTDDATPTGESDTFEESDLATESDSSLDSLELDTPKDTGLEDFSLAKEVPMPYYDEDEDDLPSLDDEFYQSTARRYGLDLNAL